MRRIVLLAALLASVEIFGSMSMASAGKLAKAGVTLTAGTDAPLAGLAFGASLHHELELLVRAGLTPVQAIQAATRNAAVVMRKDRDVGKVKLVMKDGRVVERP